MTVKELREKLEGVPEDAVVLVRDERGRYGMRELKIDTLPFAEGAIRIPPSAKYAVRLS